MSARFPPDWSVPRGDIGINSAEAPVVASRGARRSRAAHRAAARARPKPAAPRGHPRTIIEHYPGRNVSSIITGADRRIGIFMPRKSPSNVDRIVGRNIRVYRLARGLSQTDLAVKLGITFQQVQKYEKGRNRVGSGRLFQISTILGEPVTSFFHGSEAAVAPRNSSPFDLLADPQSLRLVQAFAKIQDRQARKALMALAEAMISPLKR
jgi:transcriptional regulator with XRE-family HTH domain